MIFIEDNFVFFLISLLGSKQTFSAQATAEVLTRHVFTLTQQAFSWKLLKLLQIFVFNIFCLQTFIQIITQLESVKKEHLNSWGYI